jgi:hypothetical protein
MSDTPGPIAEERPLTTEERILVRWMLEHETARAADFILQLQHARVVSRCRCGCASVDFEVDGYPAPSGGLTILGDFLYGPDHDLSGAFVFARAGVLAGIEVWSLSGSDAPRVLPQPAELRPFAASDSL